MTEDRPGQRVERPLLKHGLDMSTVGCDAGTGNIYVDQLQGRKGALALAGH